MEALIQQVLSNRVLIKTRAPVEESRGGIVLTCRTQEDGDEGGSAYWSDVVAVGPGRVNRNGVLIPMELQVGDVVLHDKHFAANEVTWRGEKDWSGQKFFIIAEGELLGYRRP